MQEQQHEVVIRGEIRPENILKEPIDIFCRHIMTDILEYHHKVNKAYTRTVDKTHTKP